MLCSDWPSLCNCHMRSGVLALLLLSPGWGSGLPWVVSAPGWSSEEGVALDPASSPLAQQGGLPHEMVGFPALQVGCTAFPWRDLGQTYPRVPPVAGSPVVRVGLTGWRWAAFSLFWGPLRTCLPGTMAVLLWPGSPTLAGMVVGNRECSWPGWVQPAAPALVWQAVMASQRTAQDAVAKGSPGPGFPHQGRTRPLLSGVLSEFCKVLEG